jgi:hypothetical protein
VIVDSLKALDPERPIREADISGRFVPGRPASRNQLSLDLNQPTASLAAVEGTGEKIRKHLSQRASRRPVRFSFDANGRLRVRLTDK